ncbi:hypothetical protein SDRG_06414 [Saprolegnia diclina VS20]|uniref:CID domain-containing protein n=1 Tax=Saprolegnia diclina (strain VS20) TaxID=1156394 RepID=T0QEH1_SAPDV|nr:hypothetical protein SDRG_06414 [Saprolegnia diclina VS20]EQC36309.1 hypothetical protein SDRG_06414 [Saprolegnia diclina VS20]|eukprot:XP_008610415.1 hypothetical protein SDRG_06414 [Saprolegnia diclina VS20]
MGDERDPPAADGQPPLGHMRMAPEVDGTLGADAILSAKVTEVSEETTATTPVAQASDEDDDDDDTDFAKWNRDEIQMELADLDESGERIERVANLFLMYNQTDHDHVSALCATWLREMKAADTHDRIPFLYVANHVIFKTKTSKSSPSTLFAETFRPLLPEAVSLVCTSPADRDTVVRILKLWAEQQLYPMDDIRGLWKETGEPLPPSWSETQAATTASSMENTFATMDVEPDLPMGLKARAAHPLVDLLKRIDHAKHIVHHLEPKIQANHQYVLQSASSNVYEKAADLLTQERHPASLQAKVEACMQMIVIRNKYVKELLDLQKLVHVTAAKLLEDQKQAMAKVDTKFEQCDTIDMGLVDLDDHRRTYADEWAGEETRARERKRKRDHEMQTMEEEITRKQQEAMAENAARTLELEEEVRTRLLATQKETITKQLKVEKAKDQEYVWHPVLRELVPVPSMSNIGEEWRDH